MKCILKEEEGGFVLEFVPDGYDKSIVDLKDRIVEGKNLDKNLFLCSGLNVKSGFRVKIFKSEFCHDKTVKEVDVVSKDELLYEFDKKTFNTFLSEFLDLEIEIPFSKVIVSLRIGKKIIKLCVVKQKGNANLFIGKIKPDVVFTSDNLVPAYIMQ